MALIETELGLTEPVHFFAHRTSRRSAKKNSWNQISDFFTNSIIQDFDDSLLLDAVQDCAEWKRYTEQDIDDIEILYERFDGKGRVLSTLSDEDDVKVHEEVAGFKLDGKLWVLSGLHQAPITGKRAKFQFPLPQGVGLKSLNTATDFELPWNIYCPTVAGERNMVKWKHNLKRNQWLVENPFKDKRPTFSMCHCTGSGCGNRCINRTLQYECSPYNCNFGSQDCGNRAFTDLVNDYHERKKYATAYEVIETEKKGCGLFSVRTYNPGSLVVEYTGEVIDLDEVEHRLNTFYKDVENYYFLGLEGNYVIDAGQKGSVARFANHSCDPNSEMQKWYVNNEPRIGLFAKRPIEAGEEVTYDYNFEWFENAEPQKCYCGSKICRGFIGKRADADADSDDESIDEPISKQVSKPVSKPVKATTRADSPPLGYISSDSELEDSDTMLGSRLLDAINNDQSSSEPEPEPEPVKEEPKPKPKPKPNASAKYTPGVQMKAAVVEDTQPKKAEKKVEKKAAPTKKPSPPKKVAPSQPKSPERNSRENTQMRTTRRSLLGFAHDFEVPKSLRSTLSISMAPPGHKDEAYDRIADYNKKFGKTGIPDEVVELPKKAPEPAPKATSKPITKAKPKPKPFVASSATVSDNSKKRTKTTKPTSKAALPPKRRKLIIDTDSEEDIPSAKINEKVKPPVEDAEDISSDDSAELPKFEIKKRPVSTQNVKKEPESPIGVPRSRESKERYQPLQKKASVFSKRKDTVVNKSLSEKMTNTTKPTSKISSPQPTVYNLKKSKRKGPTQTTETYYSSPGAPENFTPTGNELVLAEEDHEQANAQPYQYPNGWTQQGYYGEHDQYGYYGDQYYPDPGYQPPIPPPQPHQQPNSGEPAATGQQPLAQQQGRYNNYPPQPQHPYYPPHYQPPRAYPGYQPYRPPPPRGYYPPQPQPPRHYQGGYYPPPPQGYPSQPDGAYYGDYYNGHTAYPPDAFTVDAEADEMLVASPPESFADEVLQHPEEEKAQEALKKREVVSSSRGAQVVDPRKRKR